MGRLIPQRFEYFPRQVHPESLPTTAHLASKKQLYCHQDRSRFMMLYACYCGRMGSIKIWNTQSLSMFLLARTVY